MNSKPTPVAVIIDECAAMDHAQDGTDKTVANPTASEPVNVDSISAALRAAMERAQVGFEQGLAIRLVDMSDPRLKAIALHAIHSLDGELRSAEYWSRAMEGECIRSEQWHPRSAQEEQARKSYEGYVKRAEHLRAALDMAREILGHGGEVAK